MFRAVTDWVRQRSTTLYICSVVLLCALLLWLAHAMYGWPANWGGLLVLALLGAITSWLPTNSDGRSHLTADNVVVLAAIPVVGVLGAGVVGLAMAGLTTRTLPLHRRIFNMGMHSVSAMAGGLAYAVAGGSFAPAGLDGPQELLWHVGLPIVVADIVNLAVNAVLLAVVIRISAGVPMRLQLVDMVTSTGLTQFAYGIIAFLVVVMWLPGGLGAVAVLVGLAPLTGARWALLQYGEEREARERALVALVAAIETRAPELEGHSARVSALASVMAQDLGLGAQEVDDVRRAGYLHDLPGVVVAPGTPDAQDCDALVERGAAMLRGLPFLSGASTVMSDMARNRNRGTLISLPAAVVTVADAYDLAIHGLDPRPSHEAILDLETRTLDVEMTKAISALRRATSAAEAGTTNDPALAIP